MPLSTSPKHIAGTEEEEEEEEEEELPLSPPSSQDRGSRDNQNAPPPDNQPPPGEAVPTFPESRPCTGERNLWKCDVEDCRRDHWPEALLKGTTGTDEEKQGDQTYTLHQERRYKNGAKALKETLPKVQMT
ncbi:hypothetical protein EYF80_048212 [Liparis tanakae]|uniref:Uncharacterized protein n=1 Tax=Liparis tanakae TaxID=230148 RepID=A0A4Z2FKD4_9TELE|nr:hypothetical protein EYF80_048212 [Liparis tanakae]